MGKIRYICYFFLVYIKMIQTKTYAFQRDLGNLAVVTHLTLARGTHINHETAMETRAWIQRPEIYGTESHRIWDRNYAEAAHKLQGRLESVTEMLHKTDEFGIDVTEDLRLWKKSASELDHLFLQGEFDYAQDKVKGIIKNPGDEWTRASICSLPFYLQLARGYARLIGDSHWSSERVAAVAAEGFEKMYRQTYQLMADLINDTFRGRHLEEGDCRRVLPTQLYTDDIRATAEALVKYAKIEIDEAKLKNLEELYSEGLRRGKIKNGPEWGSGGFDFK